MVSADFLGLGPQAHPPPVSGKSNPEGRALLPSILLPSAFDFPQTWEPRTGANRLHRAQTGFSRNAAVELELPRERRGDAMGAQTRRKRAGKVPRSVHPQLGSSLAPVPEHTEGSQGLTHPGTQPDPAESDVGLRGRAGGCLQPWQPTGEFILGGRCPIDSCTHLTHNTASTNAVDVYS